MSDSFPVKSGVGKSMNISFATNSISNFHGHAELQPDSSLEPAIFVGA
jgi:hypothetical protein